jgi:hypothetical protein
MLGRKRLLRVTAVLSVAIATGQAVESIRSSASVAEASGSAPMGLLALNEHLPSSASLYPGGMNPLPDLIGITPVTATSVKPDADACAPDLSLTAAAGAMVDIALRAPCHAGERIVIRHSGISFTSQMGLDGRLSLSLPALETEALVAAYFEGSAVALATVVVPDVAERSRFAFQAPFPVMFELRAEEGDTIHVGGFGASGLTASGQIVTLGSDAVAQPLLAQVYTFPGIDLGSSKLSVEVRITDQTCSRSFVAETRISQGGAVTAQTLPFAVPICGTSGDILLLKNLVPDPTLTVPN